ncbi:MAG TPA: alpha/beta hydrolase [Pseudomonadales bacterium]|nr:alpha/beta hydrolase [Pseudomonadales bacterium]
MQSFLPLKTALTPLQFDVALDSNPEGFEEYRHFYQLDQLPAPHRIGSVASGMHTLAVQYWLPENAQRTALLVHGYFDHVGLYHHVIHYLLKKNFAVIAFDLPGHGLSSGARAVIYDFDEYAQAIHAILVASANKKLPPITLGFGQSTGCAAWMNFQMSGFNNSIQKLILFSPLLRPHHWQPQAHALYLTLRHFVQYIPRNFRANSSNQAFLQFCHYEDPLQPRYLTVAWVTAMKNWLHRFSKQPAIAIPTLILQGELDDTVDWRYNIPTICKKIPNAQLHYLAEARHHLANESTSIRARTWQIVTQFLEI